MGFDIECIIDIQSYPGEYFCPVCRTLVYHNEAFQAQCTHVYCKPCLAHIANGSKACPYDGYLVTESDSKPLVESDKALAEKIGKVKVHCLYFRSGCTWEGTLSESASHGSGCTFGNSPVICNRCGIQLVHRQVHDHAQICPGVNDGQQASVIVSGLPKSGTTSSTVTAAVNQTAAQSGATVSQPQNPQNAATPLPGQNPNLQVNANSHTAVVAPVATLAPEHWYQQQYQQYYQQYAGYDPYQHPQQFYALQQQPFQQYQPHQVQVQGQHQSHVYSQAVVQGQPQAQPQSQSLMAQPQSQSQSQPQAQPHQHSHLQPPPPPQQQPNSTPQAPPQSHLQPQAQGQVQAQLLPQGQPQVQPPHQVQAQTHASMQAFAPNYPVNPQQPLHPVMRPQTQIPPQVLPPPPPHSQPTQPPQYPQATGVRTPAQHAQVPQYQQPHVQMYHSQASQAHGLQPQIPPQPFTQPSNQSQVQQQAQPYQSQSQPPTFHPQANQSSAPVTLPQAPPHPPVPPVSGHHPYQQPLPAQKMQTGASQQYPMHPHLASGPLHPVQAHGQVPQQSALMRPPHPQGSISQQQPSASLSQSQVHGVPLAPSQQFLPHAQQPTYPTQHRPLMQPVQQGQPQNYGQQQQFHAPFQGQMPHQGVLPPQQPMQSQVHMHPSGAPQPHQSQNYAGAPMMTNQGIHPQSQQFLSGGFPPLAPPGPAHVASTQISVNQNYVKPPVAEQNATSQLIRSPSKGPAEKGFEGGSLRDEPRTRQNETVLKDADNGASDGLVKSVVKQETDDMKGPLEQPSGGKSSEAVGAEDKFRKEEVHASADSGPLNKVELESRINLSKNAVQGQSIANYDRQSLSAVPASSTEGHALPPQSHGSLHERSETQVEEKPSLLVGPQGPGVPPLHGQLSNPTEGKAPGTLGGFKSFESQSGPQGPEPVPRGSVGRAPAPHLEGHYVSQHVVRPCEIAMSRDQLSGSADGGSHMKPHADEPNFLRANGGIALNSSAFGSRDENLKPFSREQSNFFPTEPTRPLEQASRSLDKPFHGYSYDSGSKLDPGALVSHSRFLPHHPSGGHSHGDLFGPGSEFGQHPRKPFAYQSPGGDYLGSSPRGIGGASSFPHVTSAMDDFNSREAHRFGEGSRSFHLSSDPVGHSFRDGRFPPLPGHLRRGDIDGPVNPRFGEHRPPSLIHNHMGSDDVFGQDGPGHLKRGKFTGPGYLHGHFNMGETEGPGSFHGHGRAGEVAGNFPRPRPPFSDSVRVDTPSFQPFGDPALRNDYSFHGFPNAGKFTSGRDSFDQSRKRIPASTGWCKICEYDCETVERLEMHSQTREHQNMALEIVKRIKLQNKKNQRASGRTMHEGGSRSRKVGSSGRETKR